MRFRIEHTDVSIPSGLDHSRLSHLLANTPAGAVPGRARGAFSSFCSKPPAVCGLYAEVGLLFHLMSELCARDLRVRKATARGGWKGSWGASSASLGRDG